MLSSPYPFFESLSREITQMQADYRHMKPLGVEEMAAAVRGLRQNYVPVLTDGAYANQLAIVRGHGREGYMTAVLDVDAEALAFYSRFSIPVRSPDYSESPAEFMDFLMDAGRRIRDTGKTPVLVVGDAETLLDGLLDFGMERLNEVFVLNQDYPLQAEFQDKFRQYELAREFDIPTPATWEVDDKLWKEKPELPFPVLVKERRGKELFRATGRQAFEASSWDELKRVVSGFPKGVEGLLVQEKITDEGQEHMYSIGAYCGRHRRPVALFSSQRLRATRPFGSTALSVSVPFPEGTGMADQFLRETRYYGSCELELIYDGHRKQLMFLELNNRLYKTQSLATHCGINLNHLALLDVMGKKSPPVPEQTYGPCWWLMESDLASGIRKMARGEMSFQEWMGPLSFDFVNGIDELDDPLPGFVNLFRGNF